jgi:hypothetical protein
MAAEVSRWVFPGNLRDGTQVDLVKYLHTGFRLAGHEKGDMVSLEKPEMIYDRFPSQRWSKLFDNLRSDSANLLRLGYRRPPHLSLSLLRPSLCLSDPHPSTSSQAWSLHLP